MRLMDSTTVAVLEHLKERATATRQDSGKIQYEFDFLTGQSTIALIDFDNINDTKMGAKRITYLNEQELCMQDLGYFAFQQLKV